MALRQLLVSLPTSEIIRPNQAVTNHLLQIMNTFFRAVLLMSGAIPLCLQNVQAATTGTVASWGQGIQPSHLTNVVAISAGDGQSLALKNDGTVAVLAGDSRLPAGLAEVTAISAGGFWSGSLALKRDGTVIAWGDSRMTNVPTGLSGVVSVSTGGLHCLALKSDGTVAAWGDDTYGQSTVPPALRDIVAVSAGYFYSLALKSNGTVIAWGENDYGQTNVPIGLSNAVAISAGALHALALKADGTVIVWGNNAFTYNAPPAGLGGVVAVSGGYYHSLALKNDGTVVAWGSNGFGQASVPPGLIGAVAIAAGYTYSLALISSTVQTLAATAVTATSAQLNGYISPNGLPTTAYFQYGATVTYGRTTPSGNFGTTVQNIAYNVTGLVPNTSYHFRIVASNSSGTSTGGDVTFTTGVPGAPTVQTLAAANVTTTSAQLNGSINPNGFPTTAYFEYGPTTSYGSSTPSGNFGTTLLNIGFVQTALSLNATYHYRIVASNSQGTSRGLDASFTTLPTTTSATTAWVAGTSGLGLRLRSAPSLSASVLVVMPEGSSVTLLGDTQTADGYLWRHLTYASQTGWAAAQYLSFTPGATPTPPDPPINLRQLQPDGFSPIPVGGSISASSVVLAATPSGPSAQQFTVQFEVRQSGTPFSGPTATSTLVQGGSEARASVGTLANQGYHWRTRVLDASGVPSQWVAFSGNTTDFTLNAGYPPSALFTWSPSQIFTGDSVAFSAEATAGTGFTFNWSFGGTQTASGPTADQAFAQAGDVTVTLTVTDSQSNQSQHTETITVLSKDLLNEINHLAQQTSQALQQLQVNGVTAAADADYFQERTESYRARVGINLAFGILGAGMPLADFKTLLRSSLPAVAVDLAVDADTLAANAGAELFAEHNSGLLYADIFAQPITSFVSQRTSAIEQYRQQAVAAVSSLTPAQAEQLTRNLRARLKANLSLSSTYNTKVTLPNTFSMMESTVGDAWSTFEVGTTLATTLLTAGSSTAAAFLLAESGNLAQSTLDQLTTLQQQPLDVQMLAFSLDALGQAWVTADRMAANAANGFLAVINAQPPTMPQGTLTVQFMAPGSEQQFWYGQRWITTSAYAEVTIRNTGQVAATYRVEAAYPHTFTPSNLGLPFDIPGFNTTLDYLFATDDIQLAPNDQVVLTDYYLSPAGGQKPDGLITYTLTARTPGSCYLEASQSGQFNTTLIDTNGNQIDHSTIPDTLLSDAPVQSSLIEFASGVCSLRVVARNALGAPLLLNIQQDLPAGTVVVDAGGSTIGTNRLMWELAMQPGQVRSFQAVLTLPTPLANPPLTNTTSSAYDALNAVWLQFSQAPAVSQMASPPPPQLQPAGFTGGGFGLALQALVPGIYRVEATSDFLQWDPVLTVTNTAGPSRVTDPAAQSHPARFYRALRQ